MSMKGLFKPKHPEKYMGDVRKIRIMSSWELRVFIWMDESPAVVRWVSETVAIPYRKPTDNKIHEYFPDIYCEIQRPTGELKKYLLEIKPMKEVALKKKSSTYDKLAILINQAKWSAAKQVCDKNGIVFSVLTENDLFMR